MDILDLLMTYTSFKGLSICDSLRFFLCFKFLYSTENKTIYKRSLRITPIQFHTRSILLNFSRERYIIKLVDIVYSLDFSMFPAL